jgi:prolyl-tRNA synthetase
MKFSNLFSQTWRDKPTDVEFNSAKLLIQAGYIRKLASGIYSYLPLAVRSIRKIEKILREEMNMIGGQEIVMPVVNPANIWQESKRWYLIGEEMGRFQDRNKRDMVLAMTHEEIVGDIVRNEIKSYKQLPALVYQIQTKWRDDPRPRGGLIRVREFTMKDSYSFDSDNEGLDKQYNAHYNAYFKIFKRCGLPVVAVGSDVGMMGGALAHEFIFLNPIGEDSIMICESCNYMANRQVAEISKEYELTNEIKIEGAQEIETPNIKTIEEVANFFKVNKKKIGKTIFYYATVNQNGREYNKILCCCIRSDYDINITKITGLLPIKDIRLATEDEVKLVGAVIGYSSPVNLKKNNVIVIIDDTIEKTKNLIIGANKLNYHLINANYGKDFVGDIISDIALARENDNCPICKKKLISRKGVEVGNIFKLGTKYSELLGCYYQDKDSCRKPIVMGSYGIGVGRLLACIVEHYSNETNIILPITVAPYHVHMVNLSKDKSYADNIYDFLRYEDIEIIYDDRIVAAGIKLKDAELIGIPIIIVVGEKSLKINSVEVIIRSKNISTFVKIKDIICFIKSTIKNLFDDINSDKTD